MTHLATRRRQAGSIPSTPQQREFTMEMERTSFLYVAVTRTVGTFTCRHTAPQNSRKPKSEDTLWWKEQEPWECLAWNLGSSRTALTTKMMKNLMPTQRSGYCACHTWRGYQRRLWVILLRVKSPIQRWIKRMSTRSHACTVTQCT